MSNVNFQRFNFTRGDVPNNLETSELFVKDPVI